MICNYVILFLWEDHHRKSKIYAEFVVFPQLRAGQGHLIIMFSDPNISSIVTLYYPFNIKAKLVLWRLFYI